MSQTSATVILDSISPTGHRLTTLQVRFPRFILAEFNTHRTHSRNFRSSRAVPVQKLCREVYDDPFIPAAFTRNKPGMQGGVPLQDEADRLARKHWEQAAREAANHASLIAKLGVHKQYANRLLEPFLYVDGVISATEWANFFTLRLHPDAQPEFQELANKIYTAMQNSTPKYLVEGDWHIPYIQPEERQEYDLEERLRISAARCAWVSYKPFDADADTVGADREFATFTKLVESDPKHASPTEHQAQVSTLSSFTPSNFQGWTQYRRYVEFNGGRVFTDPRDE